MERDLHRNLARDSLAALSIAVPALSNGFVILSPAVSIAPGSFTPDASLDSRRRSRSGPWLPSFDPARTDGASDGLCGATEAEHGRRLALLRCYNGFVVNEKPVVHSDPDIMSGTPVFVGTRVPFQTLIDYLEAGQPLSDFLDDFPTVSREQAIAALEQAKEALLDRASPA